MDPRASVQGFVAGLPPAVVQMLQILYDINLELQEGLECSNMRIRQLKEAHTEAMQKKDHELRELQSLLSNLQGAAPHPAAAAVQPTQPAGLDSPSTHPGVQRSSSPGAATFKRSRPADRLQEDSRGQHAGGLDLQDSGAAAANAPQHKRSNLGTHSTQQPSAAARTSSTGLAPPPSRGMKPLPAGTTRLSQQQVPAHTNMPAGPAADRKAGDRGAQAATDQDAAGLLQFLAASKTSNGQKQGQPIAQQQPAQPPAVQERQHAEAAVYAYLKQHGGSSSTTNRVMGNSSGGGTAGMMSSDGGSAATGFSPAPHHHNQQHSAHAASGMRAAAAAALAAECAAAGMPLAFAAPDGFGPIGDASGLQHLMGLNGPPNQATHGAGGHRGAAGDPYQFMAASAQQMGSTMHAMMPAAAPPVAGYGSGFEGWQMPGMQGSMGAAAAAADGMGMTPQQLEMAQPQETRRNSASSAGRRGSKADDQMQLDSSTRPMLNLAN